MKKLLIVSYTIFYLFLLSWAVAAENTDNNKATFNIDGRVQIDVGAITKGKTNAYETNAEIRRLWLGVSGNINQNWDYRFIAGFKTNQISIYDAFLKYQGFRNADVVIGNFFENNGIDIGTFNIASTMMERSSGITTFRQLRRSGISINPYGRNWGLHFGLFGNNPRNSNSIITNANNKGQSLSGRGHVDLIDDKKNAESLHIGFNSTYRQISSDTNQADNSNKTMRFKAAGDSHVLDLALIDTKNIYNVGSYYQNMGEFRYQRGPLSITSEYIKTTLNRSGEQKLNFSGGYLMASYFLTKERYGYDSKMGIQSMPYIQKNGAWEIAARYSTVNLNSKNVNGGKLNSYDFGINFYPNNNLKLATNYIFNRVESLVQTQKNPQYLMFRIQAIF